MFPHYTILLPYFMKFVYVLDITQVSLHQRTQRLIVLKAQSEHMPGKILHWFGSLSMWRLHGTHLITFSVFLRAVQRRVMK